MRYAVFGNTCRPDKIEVFRQLFGILRQHGAEIAACRDLYDYLTSEGDGTLMPDVWVDDDWNAEVAISVGGDGTFLQTAKQVGSKGIPILGINTGRLGFLADVSPQEMSAVFAEIHRDDYRVEERSALQILVNGMPLAGHEFALNEVAVLKRDSASMISIRTFIDGAYLHTFQADGLLIATPTGSTGYSLSVGGPIMVPQAGTFVITAVAPHSLNVRPLVICDSCELTLEVESRSHNFLVAVDGRNATCHETSRLSVAKAPHSVRVLKRMGHSFFDTLHSKMKWGVDERSAL